MDFHFATAMETVADCFPNRIATIADGRSLDWESFERRAASIAGLLEAHGISADSKVGLYLHNSNEYQEAQFGVFKVGGCPINVNYRYKADELVYLLDNSDAEAVFFQSCYAMRIWEIRDRLTKVKLLVQIDDRTEALLKGAVDYERAIRDNAPLPRQVAQSARHLYALHGWDYGNAQRRDVPNRRVYAIFYRLWCSRPRTGASSLYE
jgi:fatty-acyl-CoA synthase